LLAIPEVENGETITRYLVADHDAEVPVDDEILEAALAAIGSWSDLDWDETEAALHAIRHQSKPTPPIDLDDIL
jgi:hypothetical protein